MSGKDEFRKDGRKTTVCSFTNLEGNFRRYRISQTKALLGYKLAETSRKASKAKG
jgi:hypothetical protein